MHFNSVGFRIGFKGMKKYIAISISQTHIHRKKTHGSNDEDDLVIFKDQQKYLKLILT